jgi:HK97 family phage major capsid protein
MNTKRLKEIEARKLEIRTMLEGNEKVNMEELETELRSLNDEKVAIEKRMAILDEIVVDEEKAEEIEKPVEEKKEERKVFAQPKSEKRLKLFNNFGEQLMAIKRQATTGVVDDRLLRIANESRATGGSVGIGSDGGFAVQTDFAGMMMETAAKSGNILPLVDNYGISDNSDNVKWVDIDETDVSSTVYGGVRVYRRAEAATVTATKPKLVEREIKLEALMGLAYATWELEKHSNFVSEMYTKSFTKAIQRKLESEIIAGLGAGECLGFQKGGDRVSVAKESGQAADTVVYENIVKMYNRMIDKQNGYWIVNPDVQEQLDFLSFPVGVGGVPVYLPASSVGTMATLKGRPIIESDHCAALGDLGDINFANLSEYMLITKGGVEQDYSIHVNFTTAENAFRFIFLANGMPKKSSALTIANSSNKRANFVTLDARA